MLVVEGGGRGRNPQKLVMIVTIQQSMPETQIRSMVVVSNLPLNILRRDMLMEVEVLLLAMMLMRLAIWETVMLRVGKQTFITRG